MRFSGTVVNCELNDVKQTDFSQTNQDYQVKV